MSDTIDGLRIEITSSDPKKVDDGLQALAKSLGDLQKATAQLGKVLDGADFGRFGSGIKKLSQALQPLQGFKSQAGGLINSLKDFRETARDFNEFTEFDKFTSQVGRLAESLKPLAETRTQLGATLKALSEVPKIMQELDTLDFDTFGDRIKSLSNSLTPLGQIESKLGSTLTQLGRFSQVTQQLDEAFQSTNVEGDILRLVHALRPLMEMGKSNLGSVLNQLKKIPEIMDSLAKADMGVFADQMERVARAIKPLADEMQKVSQGFSAFPARIQRLIRDNERLSGSNRALNRSYGVLGTGISRTTVRFGLLYMGMRRLASRMGDWLNKSNEYVENLHLFRLAMDSATESALEFAYTVQEKMGIDVSEWMGYQAAFQNMARGFGITEEKASIMSKTLTQLGYDLAAVFNVDYEVAMQKLQSAIAGQPRPMREWGFDISETTLKMVAMGLGIEKNVELMTQMEKAQIRYIQLMETSRKQGFLGDMARTIMTPANALRVLEQQILQLKRALGEALIPVLIEFIPYVIAGTKVLTNMARAIAAMMGFELPEIDYTGLEAIRYRADDATDGLDDTTESLKKLKRQTMGFDELNILSPDTDLEGFNMGIDELGLDLSQYTYDFLGEMDTRITDLTEKVQGMVQPFIDNLPEILEVATNIGLAFLTWKLADVALEGFNSLKEIMSDLEKRKTLTQQIGLVLAVDGAIELFMADTLQFEGGGLSSGDINEVLIGLLKAAAGGYMIGGLPGLGAALAIGVAITVGKAVLENAAKDMETIKQAFYSGTGDTVTLSDLELVLSQPQARLAQGHKRWVESGLTADMGQLEILGSELVLRYARPSVDIDYVALMTSALLRKVDVNGSVITLEDPIVYTSKVKTGEKLYDVLNGLKVSDVYINLINPDADTSEVRVAQKLATILDNLGVEGVRLDILNPDVDTDVDWALMKLREHLGTLGLTGVDVEMTEGDYIPDLDNVRESMFTIINGLKIPNTAIEFTGLLPQVSDEELEQLMTELSALIGGSGVKLTISDLGIAFGEFTEGSTAGMDKFFEAQAKLLNVETEIDGITSSITEMNEAWGKGLIETQAYADGVLSQLDELIPKLNERLQGMGDNLMAALVGPLGTALEATGVHLKSLEDMIGESVDEGIANMEGLKNQAVELMTKLAESGTLMDTEWSRLGAIYDALGIEGSVRGLVDAQAEYNMVLASIGEIDFENIETVEETLNGVSEAFLTAKGKTEEYFQEAIANMRGLMDALPADSDLRPKWEAIIAATEAGMILNIGALEKGAEDFAGVIQVQLIQRMVEQFETVNEQWGDAFLDPEAFGSLAYDWIGLFHQEAFQPILSSLKSSMEDMGIEGSEFADQALNLILQGLFEYDPNSPYLIRFRENLSSDTAKVLQAFGIDAKKLAELTGVNIPEGLLDGVEGEMEKSNWKKAFETVITEAEKVYEIQSPSKVFRKMGGWLTKGLKDGIDKGLKSVVKSWSDLPDRVRAEGLTPLESYFETSADNMEGVFDRAFHNIGQSFGEMIVDVMDEWEGFPGWAKTAVLDVTQAGVELFNKAVKGDFHRTLKGEGGIEDEWGGLPDFFDAVMTGEEGALSIIEEAVGKIGEAFGDIVVNLIGFEKLFGKEVSNPVLKFLGELYNEILRMAAIAISKWVLKLILNAVGIPLLADGGFVDQGQMFVAREAGPELVGTIGNRSAVVNNDQIVASVSKGVYEAVSAAMSNQPRSSGGVSEVRVYLDGRDITRSVEVEQRDRGLDLMPGGVLVGG